VAFVFSVLKLLIEIAGLALIAQLLVGIFSWNRRQENVVYQLLQMVTRPLVKLVRWVTPKVVLDQHVPLVTFLLLLFAWVVVLLSLSAECRSNPQQPSCERVQARPQ
jgi:uncharacterized protein YggT (Ycf19 family)